MKRMKCLAGYGFLFIVIAFFLGVSLLSFGGNADISCSIEQDSCSSGTDILHIENDTGGFNNAHAQLPGQSGYDYHLCCGATGTTINTSCGVAFLELSAQTNAHVQDPNNDSITPDYSFDACMGNISGTCQIEGGSCSAGYECLLSMASSSGNNYTDAHVGECGHYYLQVCCDMNSPPVMVSSRISPSPLAYTNETLEGFCNATDADGDNVTYYYRWYLDDSLNETGKGSNHTEGLEVNVNNISNETTSNSQNWTLECLASDGVWNSSWLNSSDTEIRNTPPVLVSVTETHDPITGGDNQTITPGGQDDQDQDGLYLYCCNNTEDSCVPSSSNDVCNGGSFQYPYSDMECNFTVSVMDGLLYVRCRTYDGSDYSSNTASTNFTVDSTGPGVYIQNPENKTYYSTSVDLNVTTDENASSCWWNLDRGTNYTMDSYNETSWYDIIDTGGEGTFQVFAYCNDTSGNLGVNSSVFFTVSLFDMRITKILDPSQLIAQESETVNVTLDIKVNKTTNEIPVINITDEIPYDFEYPETGDVRIYFIDYSPYGVIEITGNSTVSVDTVDKAGNENTVLSVNISDISATEAPTNLLINDTIRVTYRMNSSEMEGNGTRYFYTNVSMTDNMSNTIESSLLKDITSSAILLRGYKNIWIPDLGNPQNLSSNILLRSYGGTVSGILMVDYLPQGASISGRNVTYYNHSSGNTVELINGTDYFIGDPSQTTLPDGMYVDLYNYNFSYKYSNWDGNLYNNDSIGITYNITVLGGGQWYLPAIISGYDPEYMKHIRTEMYASTNVPSFDVIIEILTNEVKRGDKVKAMLRILNVGGPRAKVDVFVTYAVKTMKGDLISERSETIAVVEQKEKSLELIIPDEISPGTYIFETFVTYTGREAVSTGTFEVESESPEGGIDQIYVFVIPLIVVILFVVMYVRVMRRR